MFKKKNRLSVGVKILGPSFNTRFFVLKTARNGLLHSRFGFIVSKKIDKRAVVRNSLKRKIRSCLEKNFLGIKPGFDLLFLLKKEAVDKNQLEICSEVSSELKKQKLL